MANSNASDRDPAPSTREPRPFLFLEPATNANPAPLPSAVDIDLLEAWLSPRIPQLVRSVVDFTIERHNQRTRIPQPIGISVLNRRRRAARAWLVALGGARTDAATLRAVANQWLPILCGTGPDLANMQQPARELIEFVRGAATAALFAEPADSLLPHARALHALESTLREHLGAVAGAAFRASEPVAVGR